MCQQERYCSQEKGGISSVAGSGSPPRRADTHRQAGAIVETSALGHHQEEALQVTGTFPDNIWETEL